MDRVLSERGKMFDIENMGCHTLRKTLGYHYYNKTRDIAALMELYNHSSPVIILRYIEINQDKIDLMIDIN